MVYKLIRSARKSVSIQIDRNAQVIVRAPLKMKKSDIDKLLVQKESWISTHLEMVKENIKTNEKFTKEELEVCRRQAKEDILPILEDYAYKMGLDYNSVTFRFQTTRWGSCSNQHNLNFNCLLALLPREIQEYVVVHELAHLREMNHSLKFWKNVEKVMPDYKSRRKYLKTEGGKLITKLKNTKQME
ncbi:MAG: M48 family metallopeptidase [Lachnospiraceae bacterium]|nr:M48 family metallopeptidase [Lachnospiraceae bacterium]